MVPSALTSAALKSPWVVQPVFSGFSILSPSWLWITMPGLLAIVVIVTRLVSGTRMTRVRRVPAWRSATAGVEGADCYTAYGFANPTRRVLAACCIPGPRSARSARSTERARLSQRVPGILSRRPHDGHTPAGAHLGYSSDVIEVVETYLYRPMVRPLKMLVRAAKRLQSGRLDAYLAYMLVALIALIAIVVALV